MAPTSGCDKRKKIQKNRKNVTDFSRSRNSALHYFGVIINQQTHFVDKIKMASNCNGADASSSPSSKMGVDDPQQMMIYQQIDPSILSGIHFLPANGAEPRIWHQSDGGNSSWDAFEEFAACEHTTTGNQKLSPPLDNSFSSLPFHDQIAAFEQSQQLTKDQYRIRWQIAVDLVLAIRKNPMHRNCDASVFGSMLTGHANPKSDINISVDIDGDNGQTLRSKSKEERKSTVLDSRSALEVVLKEAPSPYNPAQKLFSTVTLYGKEIAFIQLQEAQTGIKVSLWFDNELHVLNSKLLQFYMCFEPRTKPLLIFLKYWAKSQNIGGPGRLKKRTLTILILVFLMQNKLIPSVLLLQAIAAFQRSEPRKIQDTPYLYFCDNIDVVKKYFKPAAADDLRNSPEENARMFLNLVTKFFETIVATEFYNSLVSPHLGLIVCKNELSDTVANCVNALPAELGEYWKKFNPTYFNSQNLFSAKAAVYIQDPFELHVNIAKCYNYINCNAFVTSAQNALVTFKNPSTIFDLFERPSNQLSEIDSYLKKLVGRLSKPESEVVNTQKENTIMENIIRRMSPSKVPVGLFQDLGQSDANHLRLDITFLNKYMAKLYSLRMLGGSNGISNWKLAWQATAVWRIIVRKFMLDIFPTGLNLKDKELVTFRYDVDWPCTEPDTWKYDDTYTQTCIAEWEKNGTKQIGDEYVTLRTKVRNEVARQQIEELKIPKNEIEYGATKYEVTYPFWRRKFEYHGVKKCPLCKEVEISQESYKEHLQNTSKSPESACFAPFFVYVLHKFNARADKKYQKCGDTSITFVVQELNEGDVEREVRKERMLARKCIQDVIQRTFEPFQLYFLQKWFENGLDCECKTPVLLYPS